MELVNSKQQTKPKYSTSLNGKQITINDLREKEFRGERLTEEETIALSSFDKFRIDELNRQVSDDGFQKMYRHFQVMANLSPYEDFIRGKYSL